MAARPDIARAAALVAVSSEWSSDFGAAKAVDGNLSTEWSSAGDGNRAFITIDLGRRSGPFPAGDRLDVRPAAVAFTGRKLRFEVVRSTGGNTGASEVEVFAGR